MTLDDAFHEIKKEFARACTLHEWPENIAEQALIVSEEAGEFAQAVNNYIHHDGPLDKANTEAYHNIVTSLRFILNNQTPG